MAFALVLTFFLESNWLVWWRARALAGQIFEEGPVFCRIYPMATGLDLVSPNLMLVLCYFFVDLDVKHIDGWVIWILGSDGLTL
jgi:hypothetical protein